MTPNTSDGNGKSKVAYWHRELPPVEADPVAEHTIEAESRRVAGSFAHRDKVWDSCHAELMANAETRLMQEVSRLGGDYAHVHDEVVEPKHDDASGQVWLHGRFHYVLYRRPLRSQ